MNSRTSWALVAALLLALGGCAAPGPVKHASLQAPAKADEGVVVVKVIGVQPLSAFNAKWGALKLADKKTGRTAELRDTAPPSAGYSLFIGALPAGQYSITGFHSDGMAPGTFGVLPALVIMSMTSDSQSLGAQLGTFTVRPAALSNLGLVVSALPEDKKSTFKVAVVADADGQASTLEDVEPETRHKLKAMPNAGWDQAPDPQAAGHALDIVRRHARNVSAMEVLEDSRVVVGSALGMVHVRDRNGQWTTLSTGSLDNITYVRGLPDGRLFAGTDAGRYHLWLPDAKAWRTHALQQSERIVHLEPLGTKGFAMLTQSALGHQLVMAGSNRVLVKSDLDAAEPPKQVLNVEGASAVGKVPLLFDGKDLLMVFNHIGFSRTADLYRIDPATLQHKAEKQSHWTQSLYALPGSVVVRERMNGLSIYTDISQDGGRTWTMNEQSGPHSMRFLNARDGYGLSLASRGWDTVTLQLNKTSDGGRQWTKVGNTIESANPGTVRVVGDRIFVFTGLKLLSSTDEGKTWNVEWPQSGQ